MDRKFLSMGLMAMALGIGCSSDPAPGNTTDAGTTPPTDTGNNTDAGQNIPDAGPGSTFDYVINRLLLDEGQDPPGTRGFYGFNLDDRYSGSTASQQMPLDCNHGDYFSTIDTDQNMGTCTAGMPGGGSACHGGVDNQLPVIAQTLQQFQASLNVQALLDGQTSGGDLTILVRVSGVNGTPGPTLNDPSVHVSVYPNAWALFPNCADINMPGQMYQVDNRSLNTPGDLSTAKLQFDGRITNGRLIISPSAASATQPNFSIPLPIQGVMLSLDLYKTQLRVTMNDADRGTNGNLGGYVRQTVLLDALTMVPALMPFRDAAAPLIEGFVDVATNYTNMGASCTNPEGGIGMGLGFTTVRAVIAPTSTATRPATACGAPSGDGGTPTTTDAGAHPDA